MSTTTSKYTRASSNGTGAGTGDTTAVAAPAAGFRIRVRKLVAANDSATGVVNTWKDGAGGTKLYPAALGQNGNVTHDLKDKFWDLTAATALVMNNSAAGSVNWQVEYEVVPV